MASVKLVNVPNIFQQPPRGGPVGFGKKYVEADYLWFQGRDLVQQLGDPIAGPWPLPISNQAFFIKVDDDQPAAGMIVREMSKKQVIVHKIKWLQQGWLEKKESDKKQGGQDPP